MTMGGPRERLRAQLERQVRDPRVVAAMMATPRDVYVPGSLAAYAWDDRALPVSEGQTISQPTMVALMLEGLEPEPTDVVLDVGTGSGYQAAVLARLVRHVFGMEIRPSLARRARDAWARDPGIEKRCSLVVADAHHGFPGRIRFEGILVAAASDAVPTALLDQLAPGGRLLAPLGPPGIQELTRIRRRADGSLSRPERLGACAFVPLVRGGTARA